ncbi:MAG: hypothetical protein EHM41_02385 [Chloroflexi bacterium]|nr:MAG: hypothetical protein EHM41_02385 [Chloroflexota bacterium]
MDKRRRYVHFVLILLYLLSSAFSVKAASGLNQEDLDDRARQMLERLTPEEKVGQLFLVTFTGPDAGPRSQIHELITNYHIGGVFLLTENDNFLASDQTLPLALSLTRQLQATEYSYSSEEVQDRVTGVAFRPAFIPLFIGISQEGDGYPYNQILNGLSPLPSQMAIGATWNKSLAYEVGNVMGSELSTLGINMILGPSLDVIETPHVEGSSDLGVRAFGGDPYWVGEMGREFIAGLHAGSQDEMVVVAKHFPGYGSSDRLPEEEVATVRKSLEQLQRIELYPFFAVTGNAQTPEQTADALLTSHIRYQGFQENIRATTKPVTLDPQAFSQLMSLPAFSSWRSSGGVMITNDLGGLAMRKFYESSGQAFNGRNVARDAFLAGNDLLYVGNFSSIDQPDSFVNIVSTLDYFSQKYREDELFAARVDESVLRILKLKYKLYDGTFTLTNAWAPASLPGVTGTNSQVSFDVAQQAATLINPSQNELANIIPDPPGRNDSIVFITDVRTARQCSRCPMQNLIAANAFENAVLRLYSPSSGGQILPSNLISYTLDDLQAMLDAGIGVMQIEADLQAADWIVFSMLNVDQEFQSSSAVKQFLGQRPDLIQDKRLIAFAFNAPYYLDATDISKITAYYALYSKTPKSIDVAVRLLFQELRPAGSLPVSVTGAGYDLNEATFPNPNQTISLMIDQPSVETSEGTPQVPLEIDLRIGNSVPVRTGVILDLNGHPVPDNTVVQFYASRGDGSAPAAYNSETKGGVARAVIRLDHPGLTEIWAESELAKTSQILTFEIPTPNDQVQEPSATPEPTETATPEPTPTFTPTPTEELVVEPIQDDINFGDWFLALIVSMLAGGATYWLAKTFGYFRWSIRFGLLALIGGLLAYLYLALGMPGSETVKTQAGIWGIVGVTLLGSFAGGGSAFGWHNIEKPPKTNGQKTTL